MANSVINIAMCFDDGYVFPSKIALYSLFRNNPQHKIDVYVIHAGLSTESQSQLQELTRFFPGKRIIFKEIDDKKIREEFSKTLVLEYISIATYYRYVIAEELPEINKILYIDGDILFNGDILPMWETPLDDHLYATVQDNWMMTNQREHLRDIGFNDSEIFFIAGLLLMNLKQIREEGTTEKLFNLTSSDEYKGRLKFQDQDALNIVCKGRIKQIPIKNHYISYDFYKDPHSFDGIVSAHYAGAVKPWKNRDINGGLDIYFLQIYNNYMDGMKKLLSGNGEFEWRDLYEESVRQKHAILSLQYDLSVTKTIKGSIRNVFSIIKARVVKR